MTFSQRCLNLLFKIFCLYLSLECLCFGYNFYTRTLRPSTHWEEYQNEWAIVTGASYGIGEGFAQSLAKRGLNLFLIARSQDKLEQLKKDLISQYPKIQIKTMVADLSKSDYLSQFNQEIQSLNVSVLINNVGGLKQKKQSAFIDADLDAIEYDLLINVLAPLKITHSVLPIFKQRNKGRILTIASVNALFAPFGAVYGASKRSLISWTESIQYEFYMLGLDITAVVSVTGIVKTKAFFDIMDFYKAPKDQMDHVGPTPLEFAEAELNLFGTHIHSTAHWKHSILYYVYKLISIIPMPLFKLVGNPLEGL